MEFDNAQTDRDWPQYIGSRFAPPPAGRPAASGEARPADATPDHIDPEFAAARRAAFGVVEEAAKLACLVAMFATLYIVLCPPDAMAADIPHPRSDTLAFIFATPFVAVGLALVLVGMLAYLASLWKLP